MAVQLAALKVEVSAVKKAHPKALLLADQLEYDWAAEKAGC